MKRTCTFLLFILIGLSACKKEDNSPAKKIIGRWTAQKHVVTNTDADGKVITSEKIFDSDDYVLFNKDGSGEINIESSESIHQPFTYMFIGDSKLSLNYPVAGGIVTYEIINVSKNSIILRYESELHTPDLFLKVRDDLSLKR